jgi:glutathione S-transferase
MLPILYAFPISHFSEKARWGLDCARFPHEVKQLIPGEHIEVIKKLSSESHVPVLQLEDRFIQGSSQILDFVEIQAFGVLATEEERKMEAEIDEVIGKGLQTIIYHFILGYPEIVGHLFSPIPPSRDSIIPPPENYEFLALMLKRRYKINAKNVEKVMTDFTSLSNKIQEIYRDRKFFNGISFGRVDLTLASLMGSLIFPVEAPSSRWFAAITMPDAFLSWRDSLHLEALFATIRGLYSEFRIQSK